MGEASQPLQCGMNSHHLDVMHRRTEEFPVAAHFNNDPHSQADVTITVIDEVHNHNSCLHKTQESRWIRTLRNSSPSGMNLLVDSLWSLPALSIDFCGLVCAVIINCIGVSPKSYPRCLCCIWIYIVLYMPILHTHLKKADPIGQNLTWVNVCLDILVLYIFKYDHQNWTLNLSMDTKSGSIAIYRDFSNTSVLHSQVLVVTIYSTLNFFFI